MANVAIQPGGTPNTSRPDRRTLAVTPATLDKSWVTFLNINAAFLAPDGRLSKDVMPDLLHPNEHGHALWARAMQAALDRLMALPRP